MNGEIKIAASMLIWGSVGIFARFSTLDGLSLAFMRVLMGSAIFLVGYSLMVRGWLSKAFSSVRPKLGFVFLLGLALALNWVFFFSAILHTTIAKATLIYYLAPIIVVLFAGIFLGEDIKGRLPYVGMAFLGALMIGLQEKPSLSSGDFFGILFALAGAFFYALVTLLGRHLRDVESDALTFFQLFFATLVLAPLVALRGLSLTPRALGVVSIIALVHTFLALLLYMEGLKEVEAGEAALLSYLDPLSAVIYAFIIFGEVPGVTTAIGGALILLASALDILSRR
ncbi:DMT family transporter [Thermococcus gorgonarius]|uniref:Permease n=1 Tax=Thermococcus gorgonarius TaxID=71997 RepID=A0A2Z2M7R0_THEGO|nr:DMT family transporter [Thermococcus gorgonarius]ASJ01343.1 permease [Thermococcus gorgonarius]